MCTLYSESKNRAFSLFRGMYEIHDRNKNQFDTLVEANFIVSAKNEIVYIVHETLNTISLTLHQNAVT